MSKDNGGPAFPIHPDMPTPNDHGDPTGMTLRDYFAAKAMSVVLEQSAFNMRDKEAWYSYTARMSYLMADAMLKARE